MRRLLAILAYLSVTLFAAGYNGTWKGSLDTPHGKQQNVLTIKTEGEKLVGTLKNEMGEFPLQNGSVDGLDVFFTVIMKHDGNDVKTNFRGHMFQNEEIQFKIDTGEDTFDMIAQKIS